LKTWSGGDGHAAAHSPLHIDALNNLQNLRSECETLSNEKKLNLPLLYFQIRIYTEF